MIRKDLAVEPSRSLMVRVLKEGMKGLPENWNRASQSNLSQTLHLSYPQRSWYWLNCQYFQLFL